MYRGPCYPGIQATWWAWHFRQGQLTVEDVAMDETEETQLADIPSDEAEIVARQTKGSGYIEQDNL